MSKPLRFFVAGIIQGSLPGSVHPQDYRGEIAAMLRNAFPGATVFDPVEQYPDSLQYDDATARSAFFDLMDRAGRHDVLIAFVPEASMGTAIELWNAHNAGSVVVSITNLTRNWVVRYLSDTMLPDIPALRAFIADGGLAALVKNKRGG